MNGDGKPAAEVDGAPFGTRRKLCLSLLVSAAVGSVGYAAFANQSTKRIALVCDPLWVTQEMIDKLIRFAGGTAWLEANGYSVQTVPASVGNEGSLRRVVDAMRYDPPKLIVALGDDEVLALRDALPTIPMIFWCNTDPTTNGMALSFRNPAKLATGATSDWAGNVKPIEFLGEVLRGNTEQLNHKIGIVSNSRWFAYERMVAWTKAAELFGMQLQAIVADTYASLVVNDLWKNVEQFDALILPISTPRVTHTKELISHLRTNAVVGLFENFQALTLGAALGYQHNQIDWEMQLGNTLRLVVDGVPPDQIPIRGPDGWSFAVNRQTLIESAIVLNPSTSALISRVF